MGSSTIRRFNRTLQRTYGLIRGRQVPARHTDATFNIREMAPFRQPVPRGGRAAQPLVVANVGLSAVAAQRAFWSVAKRLPCLAEKFLSLIVLLGSVKPSHYHIGKQAGFFSL